MKKQTKDRRARLAARSLSSDQLAEVTGGWSLVLIPPTIIPPTIIPPTIIPPTIIPPTI